MPLDFHMKSKHSGNREKKLLKAPPQLSYVLTVYKTSPTVNNSHLIGQALKFAHNCQSYIKPLALKSHSEFKVGNGGGPSRGVEMCHVESCRHSCPPCHAEISLHRTPSFCFVSAPGVANHPRIGQIFSALCECQSQALVLVAHTPQLQGPFCHLLYTG